MLVGVDGFKCWVIQMTFIFNLSVTKIRMLRWMCVKTKHTNLKEDYIRGNIQVASFEDNVT